MERDYYSQAIQKLKSYRKKARITQSQLAQKSGTSKTMICNIETGKKNPTLKTIIELCQAMEISPKMLFED